jgi:uncharacterized protein YdhG (YjbR/CyaY superfamily)
VNLTTSQQQSISKLIELGKSQGYLTNSQIIDILPQELISEEKLGPIIENIIELNIALGRGEPVDIDLRLITLKSFVEDCNLSVRIKNAIAESSSYFDYGTLHDFIYNKDNHALLRRTPNLGKRSIDELIDMIDYFIEYNNVIESSSEDKLTTEEIESTKKLIDASIAESLSHNKETALKNISIAFFANNSKDLDVRTMNCLIEAEKNNSLERFFENLYDLYVAPSKIKNLLFNLPNFGKHSLVKLNIALSNLVEDEKLLHTYEELCNEVPETIRDYESISDLMEREINQIDNKRELETINLRHLKSKKPTLDKIGVSFDVTRERVRQIEAKSLLKLKSSINLRFNEEQIISWSRGDIEEFFFQNNSFISQITAKKILKHEPEPTFINLFINILSTNLDKFLNKYFFYSQTYKGWFIGNEFNEINDTNEVQENQLSFLEALQKSNWPIKLDDIANLLNEPKSVTRDRVYLNNNNSIKNIGELEFIKFKSVKVQDMFRYILRKNGAEMNLYEVQDQCNKLFKRNLTIRNVSSRLAETDGIIIVGRGKYNLIENMSLTENETELIYDFTEAFLLNQQKFISSKIICKAMHSNSLVDSEILNGYSLLGLLKSDRNNRFKCERGLMIGLKSDEFSAKKIDQIDEVIQLLEDKGSLSTSQIVFHLSQHREVLNMTIEKILKENDDMFFITHGNKWNLKNENTSSGEVIDNSPKLNELIRIAKERKIQKSINS